MKIRVPVLIVFLFFASCAQCADDPDALETLESQLSRIDQELVELRMLATKVPEHPDVQGEILTFRLDTRVIGLLRRTDNLLEQVSALEADDPLRAKFRESIETEYSQVSERVFARIEELDAQIKEQFDSLKEASGQDRIILSAQLDTNEDLRHAYIAALVRHLELREALELSNDTLLPRVRNILLLRAETLAGSVLLTSALYENFGDRHVGEGNRADMEALVAYTLGRRDRYTQDLQNVTVMMDGLDMDSTNYKALLVTVEGMSSQFFSGDVLVELFGEWKEAIGTFLSTSAPELLWSLIFLALILLIFRFLARLAKKLVKATLDRSHVDVSQLFKNTIVSLTGGVVMVIGLLVALSQVGVSVGPMLAGLGIAGFIVGFALQDTLANFASGAMILIYRPYDVDDFVDIAGASGEVKKMNLVSTTITTFDNQTLVVPNSKIWGDVIKNVTHQKIRRVDLEFGIGYADDIPKAERILAEAAADHELVLDKPETNIRVFSLGDSSVNLFLRPWVKTEDYWTVYWELTRDVKLRFDAEGINIPFPQRDVHVYTVDSDQQD